MFCQDAQKSIQSDAKIRLNDTWKAPLISEFQKEYMRSLRTFLSAELGSGKCIYPKSSQIFAAFDLTPLDRLKVVLLGQDPYHGPGQAHGLSFSVPDGTPLPPSLNNIFKERQADLGIPVSKKGCLENWAKQGVLLLNSVLTVTAGQAGSHQNKGWEKFTDAVIQLAANSKENLVFLLWGSYAEKKAQFVDRNRHLVLKSVHPSPLSAHRGFFGSKPFSKINSYLESKSIAPIDWNN